MFKKEQLIKDVEKLIDKNEYNAVSLKGVKNLSRSDLETILLYAETEGFGLMKPVGGVKDVLIKYGFDISVRRY